MSSTRLEFRILGPLLVRVDGVAVPIGGPKQRALLALLLLSANRVVSRDRLIGELFAEQSVNSADHALRNQVSRLRKVLSPAAIGEPRLVARAPGYLLRVEPGELDLEHFERLLAEGREALAVGDAAAAAVSFRASESLWQGRPLADLEFESFARVEVERLEELRLEAVEERVDAELVLGRHPALVSELSVLSAEHPYRERFRAQLMLALYRSGRQAEGLEVYRRTRTLLDEELGLEPGLELQELERAILVQDPALNLIASGRSRHTTTRERLVCPFKGLAPFEAADAEFFFGRERLVEELVARLEATTLLAVIGPSGSGKSSLLRAGLLPAIEKWQQVVMRPGEQPAAELVRALGCGLPELLERVPSGERLLVAVDQFEEVFAASVVEDERRAFIEALVEAAWDPDRRAAILIALRADFFGRAAPYVELADLLGPNHVLLGPMTTGELRRAIEGPAGRAGLEVEPALVDALVDEVGGEAGGLPLLSTALLDLWSEREGRSLTFASYERTGGVTGAVGRHAEAAFQSLAVEDQQIGRQIVLRLVAGEGGEALTRRRTTREELDAEEESDVAHVLSILVERRLLVADNGTVELAHDALLEQWPRLVGWLEEDAQGRRLHRHLTQAAAEWDASRRESSELYRGPRLAAAIDWADAAGEDAGLNRLERQFLEASRIAHARATRRLRALLAAAVVLLLAALVAGGVALAARGSAKRQATAAIAQRLGAQALSEPKLDRALLLAREGVALDDTVATRSNLLASLLRSPAALAVLNGGGTRVVDDTLSADGRLLAVRADDGSVSFFDTHSFRALSPGFHGTGGLSYGNVVRPLHALAFSPDGRTLAVGDNDGYRPTLTLVDTRTYRSRAQLVSTGAATADVAYAPDGRTLVTGETTTGRNLGPPEVLVARRASDGSVLRRSRPIPGGRLVGFVLGGRDLLVTSGETESFLLDARTFARTRTIGISGSAAISFDGTTAAFGGEDGSLTLVSLRSDRELALNGRAPGRVTALGFSRDGRLLASGADDGTVEMWDVATRTLQATYKGHAAAAISVLFDHAGATLYSASSDGSVMVWDVAGKRRLGRSFRFSSLGRGAATAVAASPDSSYFVTSPAPNRITLWRARDLHRVGELHGPCGYVVSLAWSHDGRLVACTGDGPHAVVWDVTARRIDALYGPSGRDGGDGVNFSPDDKLLAVVGSDGHVRVYDVRARRRIADVPGKITLQDVDFSSDGERLAAAGLGQSIVIWDVVNRKLERKVRHDLPFLSIRFSPDGREIATGDIAGNVDFWDAATGHRVRRTLGGQNGLVLSVTYSPDGKDVITTSTDGKFRLWDIASGKLVGAPLPGAETGGWGTYFPDGKQVIAVFDSGTGVVWNVDPATWARTACRIAHRNLTKDEWGAFLPERHYRRVCP